MCGEQYLFQSTYKLILGSPPRVRGTEPHFHGLLRGHGITPACAGNSTPACAGNSKCGDHPRVCGEQQHGKTEHEFHVGSPPRVRGTEEYLMACELAKGITPACAGNSGGITAAVAGTEDHPRVCGEQRNLQRLSKQSKGSPPRVRGTGLSDSAHRTPVRITPACAGNSF